jgi:hypothetical protein
VSDQLAGVLFIMLTFGAIMLPWLLDPETWR